MRGKGNFHVVTHTKVGITPAYAGKRIAELQTPAVSWDHPRVCGEKVPITCVPKYALGSPPRMRGKGLWLVADFVFLGITPAYAGKSGFGSSSSAECWDHPRVCGEKWRIRWKNTQTTGSPPRMRGKAMPRLFLFPFWRITPAYAGKRLCFERTDRPRRDHPRVCGEKSSNRCWRC